MIPDENRGRFLKPFFSLPRKQRHVKIRAMEKAIKIAGVCIGCMLIIYTTSCVSVKSVSRDNGNHNGWYKNPKNPHHPDTVKPQKQTGNSQKTKTK